MYRIIPLENYVEEVPWQKNADPHSPRGPNLNNDTNKSMVFPSEQWFKI